MRFFIDTAGTGDIKKANTIGAVCREVSADAVDAESMIAEGRAIAAAYPRMVVTVPMTAEGMKACKALAAEGVRVNVAMMFSANQALQAARTGAAFVSPFSGRLHEVNQRGVDLIREIADLFSVCEVNTRIIATNIHSPEWAAACERAGADIAVVPYDVLEQINREPQAEDDGAKA